jgi:hypothetical protein
MKRRLLVSLGILAAVVTVVSLALTPVAAQSNRTYKAPRTVDGQPDLQGVWDFRTVTPLERPAEFAGKEFLTPEEAATFEKKIVESNDADTNRSTVTRNTVNGTAETQDVALAYNNFWWDRGTKVVGNMRTSLITEPKDGKIPALTPEAMKKAAANRVITERPAEGPEDRPLSERCITRSNTGPPMVPSGYNNNFQVVQTKDYVAILVEQIHDVRIIPLNGQPHLPQGVRQWLGDSRGHFEGDTLVVESTNFRNQTDFRNADANLNVVERFTRISPETVRYQFTVTDPTVWTAPFSAEILAPRLNGVIYEYACHEGNYGMEGTLSGARYLEKNTAEAAKKGSN